MARGRKSSLHIVLSHTERDTLEYWQRSTTMAAGLARQGRIILLLADGLSHSQVGQMVSVQRSIVRQWATRLLAQRLDGLSDATGRGSKGSFSPAGAIHMVRLACERLEPMGRRLCPEDWTERARQLMAE